jgi:hypothetical protein
MRSVVSGLPFKLPKDRVMDLVTYAVGRLNLRNTEMLMSQECPRVRFTGQTPEYSSDLALAFGDYVEAYNPKAHAKSNDVFVPRTEPCIALYPAVNTNGFWVLFNLNTNSYVKRSQWRKCPMSDSVIKAMNEMAGQTGVQIADMALEEFEAPDTEGIADRMTLHHPIAMDMVDDMMPDEEIEDAVEDPPLPELEDALADNESVAGEDEDDEENEIKNFLGDGGENAPKELYDLLEDDVESSETSQDIHQPPLRQSTCSTAGVKVRDERYDWNLMNLSIDAAQKTFGDQVTEACKQELLQLFVEKEALVPVKWESLSQEQRKIVVRSHMFLREMYEDGSFVKIKARLVADGRMQDRTLYNDHSSPTTKTKSVMTCLKLAARHNWDLLQLDVGGVFLCANMDESEEVFMVLDKQLSHMCGNWIQGASERLRNDGKLVVKVNKAMYGLISP